MFIYGGVRSLRYLIGFVLSALGIVLTVVTEIIPFIIITFIGAFLFASLPDDASFCDYVIANSDTALVRKRYYMVFLPFALASTVLTLGKATLKIMWKEEYFKVTFISDENVELTKISRKEYIRLRNEQRNIYTTQILSKEFMENAYTVENIGFKRKKIRLIVVCIISAIILTMLVDPVGIYLALIYEAVFIPIIILWIPEYKDAKIIQQAYDKAVKNGTQLK